MRSFDRFVEDVEKMTPDEVMDVCKTVPKDMRSYWLTRAINYCDKRADEKVILAHIAAEVLYNRAVAWEYERQQREAREQLKRDREKLREAGARRWATDSITYTSSNTTSWWNGAS